MIKLKIILCSTRPGRKGPSVADWILKLVKDSKKFKIELIDLKKENLPFHNEAELPALQKYKHLHTKKWSKKINTGEAFIFVHPEYNHGYPAPLKNALDYLFKEWNYKPVAFVSYGGVAGGSRASQMLIQVVTALKMMPLTESVHIPNFANYLNDEGKFIPGMNSVKAANVMLDELEKWAKGLNKMRDSK